MLKGMFSTAQLHGGQIEARVGALVPLPANKVGYFGRWAFVAPVSAKVRGPPANHIAPSLTNDDRRDASIDVESAAKVDEAKSSGSLGYQAIFRSR